MDKKNAIEIRNLSKSFKVQYDKANTLKDFLVRKGGSKRETHTVLKDINLNIKKGETVALIGVNGSGKSTMLKLMTKIIYPTKGTLETNGKLTSLLELGAGFHPDFTGRENIYFNAAIFGLNNKEIENRLQDIIDFSELGDAIDEPIRTYSSGMYMRLAFSIAINVDAEILLIDEILAVGDQHFQEKCYAKLEELKNSSKTIVIVSHSLDVVRKLCNRAIWIYKGEVREDGNPIVVIDSYLKQLEEDNEEIQHKELENGIKLYSGAINIDTPKSFSHIPDKDSNMLIAGWKVSNCPNERLVLKIGNMVVENVDLIPRKDVYDLFYNQYKKYITKDYVGWQIFVNLSEYESQIKEGYIEIVAWIEDENKKTIDEKSILVYVDEE